MDSKDDLPGIDLSLYGRVVEARYPDAGGSMPPGCTCSYEVEARRVPCSREECQTGETKQPGRLFRRARLGCTADHVGDMDRPAAPGAAPAARPLTDEQVEALARGPRFGMTRGGLFQQGVINALIATVRERDRRLAAAEMERGKIEASAAAYRSQLEDWRDGASESQMAMADYESTVDLLNLTDAGAPLLARLAQAEKEPLAAQVAVMREALKNVTPYVHRRALACDHVNSGKCNNACPVYLKAEAALRTPSPTAEAMLKLAEMVVLVMSDGAPERRQGRPELTDEDSISIGWWEQGDVFNARLKTTFGEVRQLARTAGLIK